MSRNLAIYFDMSTTCHKIRGVGARRIVQELVQCIESGEYAPGEMIGTEMQLVRSRRMSRSAVRRAVDALEREGLIERRPGVGLFVAAKSLAAQTLYVVVPTLHSVQCVDVVAGAKRVVEREGGQLLVQNAEGRMQDELERIRALPDSPAAGAILVSLHHPSFVEELVTLKQAGFPFVVVDQEPQEVDVPCVSGDNVAGGRLAAQYLMELGHRRVTFIGVLKHQTARERFEGFRDAILDAGMPFNRHLVVDLPVQGVLAGSDTQVATCIDRILGDGDVPTGVFCDSDAVAVGVYKALRDCGIAVPTEMSVIGYDNSPYCDAMDPPLTSVDQHSAEMGQTAMNMLLTQLNGGELKNRHRRVSCNLIKRDSVAPQT